MPLVVVIVRQSNSWPGAAFNVDTIKDAVGEQQQEQEQHHSIKIMAIINMDRYGKSNVQQFVYPIPVLYLSSIHRMFVDVGGQVERQPNKQ